MKKIDRTGECNISNNGSKMWIKEYYSIRNITIEFENGEILYNREYYEFKKGQILSSKCRTLLNIGYLDTYDNVKKLKSYQVWVDMLKRCYSKNQNILHPSYFGCSVINEWLSFNNFRKWYDKNYYTVEDEIMCLDKDILVKGNKVYSPETCIIVPKNINTLFINSKKTRGKYPIGVHFDKDSNKFKSSFSKNGIPKRIGRFKTAEEAFNSYKLNKEDNIKEVANRYKDKIPKKLYDAMLNYNIEMTD